MNIYSFIGSEQRTNLEFVNSLMELPSLKFHENFEGNLLSTIEKDAKNRIIHIILYESKLAVECEMSVNGDDFIKNLSNSDEWIEYFNEEYPWLGNFLKIEYDKIRNNIRYAIESLSADYNFLSLNPDLELEKISIGEGDYHDGLSTCMLTFHTGNKLYFKPRSLAIDNFVLNFLRQLEQDMGREMFYKVENFERGKYGWSIPVLLEECETLEQVSDYYYNMGVLTAVTHFLNIEDLIYDNLISTKGKIALIDLECSFCIERPFDKESQFVLDSYAGRKMMNSVLNSGILPRPTIGDLYKEGESDASLSCIIERPSKKLHFDSDVSNVWIDHIEETIKSEEIHIPVFNGDSQTIKDHYGQYISGFEKGYFHLLNHKEKLIGLVKTAASLQLESRVIYRPTKVYAILLSELFNSESIKSEVNFLKIVNSLKNGKYAGLDDTIIKSEIRQLKNFDIAAFKKIIGVNNLTDFSGNSLDHPYNEKSDVDQIIDQINDLNEDDFNIQKEIIINSLKVFEDVEDNSIGEGINWNLDQENVLESSLTSIVEHINKKLFIDEKGVSCIDIFSNVNNGWEIGVCGPGLSNGLDGVALLFGLYGHYFSAKEYESIAENILLNNYKNFQNYVNHDHLFDTVVHILISPFQYPTSIIYVNEVLHEVTGRYIIPQEELLSCYKLFFDRHFQKDEHFDILIGCCGGGFLFYQLYQKTKNLIYLEIFKSCSDHLLNNAVTFDNHVVWEAEKFKRLGGFSHGNSSFAVAMLLAYDVFQEKKYFDCFEKAYNYDQSLFDSNALAYQDVRYYPEKHFSGSWAHGVGGIGLSRLLMQNLLPKDKFVEEIDICREQLNNVVFSTEDNDYSINGGLAGNLEILKALNNLSGIDNKYLDVFFKDFLINLSKDQYSLLREKNHNHLFINQGMAGLGYSILRHLFTDEIPSLLILGIDSSFGSKFIYNGN